MISEHPYTLAGELAKLLEKDRIATGQIKEFIPPARLREILDIDESEPRMTETIQEALLACNASSDELLEYVAKNFTLTEILRAKGEAA